MNFKQVVATATAFLAIAALPCIAQADSPPAVFVTTTDAWNFEITPYAWLPGIKGDLTIHGQNVGVDQDFSDIFKAVKFASDALAIARYNDWVLYTQFDYFSLSTTQLENSPQRGSLDVKQFMYLAAGGYRINGWASGQTFDLLLGVQGLNMQNKLTIYQLGDVEKTQNVVDAVFMLRPSFQFGQHWLFNPTISIGGGDSKLTYQLQPQIQYQFNATWEVRAGYRKLHYTIDTHRGDEINLSYSGPIIGFGAQF
jgi:hypothetical protein